MNVYNENNKFKKKKLCKRKKGLYVDYKITLIRIKLSDVKESRIRS